MLNGFQVLRLRLQDLRTNIILVSDFFLRK